MAATIQTPTQQQQPSMNNKSVANPQLKRIVYSKYRELLGSYNDKANAIIDSLPAYMVKEDRGFHFDPKIIDEVENVVYGTPPAPPPLSTGAVPSQRMSTQMPQYNVAEAPACVQNAMMTKDKKPFTYTPGGIDLSQIKSQRMAKRLARNAQSEGTTGQQQLHRPTQSPQQNSNGGTAPGAVSQMGATAMGMPFQVLPSGPPPPPPQPGKSSAPAPPPPPSAPQNKLAPQSNGNAPRRSPTPQNFEPPPMGFRPEIKIPPNPMTNLKKVPPPQEKNNFWMEEYRKERSKSPMVGNDENDNNRSSPNSQQPETNQYSYNNNQQNDYQPQQNQYRATQSPQPMRQQQEFYTQRQPSPPKTPVQQLEQQRRIESPYQTQYSQQQQSPSIQRQSSQHASPQYQQQNSPQPQQSPTIQRQISQQYQNSPQPSPQVQRQQSIPTPQYQSSPQQSPAVQRQQSIPQQQYQSPTPPQYQQQQQQQTSPTQQQSVPWRQQKQVPSSGIQNNVSRPRDVMSPAPAESPRPQPQIQQQQQQYPAYLRSREVLSPAPELQPSHGSQPYQQKNAQVGSIYIPPVATQQQQQTSPYQDSQGPRQQQQQQQTPRQAPTNRWMNAQGQPVESQTLNRIKSPPPQPSASSNGFSSSNNTGLRLQINNTPSSSNGKERIIPIQLEQTPTPTRTQSAPGFGPQPFYNAQQQQQYSSVPSPPLTQGTPSNGQNSPNYIIRSPNQFVDQGYNQYPGAQDQPNRVTSPPMQQSPRVIQQINTAGGVKTRIIPIAVESQPDGPLNPNNARGPISQQPIVIQNDPRNQNTWGSGSATPTQSKSFRILQKITDTSDDNALESKAVESDGGDQEAQLQRPSFGRQMTSTGQINSPTIEQMKRMQLNNEQAFANRARNQDEDEKSASEDPRYRGPSNPSKTFKKLQGAVERCSPCSTDQNGTSPVMKQPQPNRYVNQRPVYSPDEHSQQYVHPSEQHVPEPKIYTGSAIPSRSFKILQAMTTPENAAESDSSDVVETDTSINECHCQQQPPPSCPYPYPYLPPCCAHPPPPPSSTSSSGADINNWQYPLPCRPHSNPHPHPHHHHPYHQHYPHHHLPYPHHPHSHQHHPHQHPAYPYPPPCSCYYYNYPPNEYDSQNCSSRSSHSSRSSFSRGRSQSQDLPNIIITPSTDDVPKERSQERLTRNQREGSVIDTLSRRLSEISKPEDNDLNMSEEEDKKSVGDKGKEPEKSPSPNNSECENNKTSSEDSSDDLLSTSSEPTTTSSSEECAEQIPSDGLQAIKSVTNIQFYNKKMMAESEDDDRTIADDESMVFDEEEEIIGEELEYDEEEALVEEMDSEEEEHEIEVFEEDDVIIMDDLSVIYEENEADLISPRPASRISSSVSETSTLANEECLEEEEAIKKDDDEDDNSNSVTVRLPLKFSFSRSSNDENIATIEVGNSQVEDKGRSFSIASIEAEPEDYETDSQDCDISVTISLSRSTESEDKKAMSISPVPYLTGVIIKEEERTKEESIWESEDEDVSVSFSLPMRNKFMDQTWSGDFTNNISNIEENKKEDVFEEKTTSVEAWRRNNSLFEENEEKKRVSEESKRKDKLCNMKKHQRDELDNEANNESLEADAPSRKQSKYVLEKSASDEANNKKLQETKNKDISVVKDIESSASRRQEEIKETETNPQTEEIVDEELDFWATLQATRKEAQLFLEKTAGYWGKTVDGKEKAQLSASENSKPKEEEKDEDFWSNIRVKNSNETEEKKETKPKTTKIKKKKKVVKVAVKEPEPEPEPEHVLTIIKLPNANNKSKVVESAIQMIQEKTKKPKKLVKQVSKEEVKVVKEALESEIVQISKAVEEEKKLIEEAKTRRASLCKAKSIEEPKIEEVIVEKEEEEENMKMKLVKEKAELKTQILNQKFFKAFVVPDKPPLMRGILSESDCATTISNDQNKPDLLEVTINETKCETSISNHSEKSAVRKAVKSEAESEASISNHDIKVEKRNECVPKLLVSDEMEDSTNQSSEIVIDEPKKLVKKKIIKTKSFEEKSDGNTLKPPKTKSVKKSSTEPKKIKKKKEETGESEVKIDESKESEEKKVVPKKSIPKVIDEKTEEDVELVQEKSKTMLTSSMPSVDVEEKSETKQEPDFWAEIESSKSNDNICKDQDHSSIIEANATDPWANIPAPKLSEEISTENSITKVTQETDFWAEIESVSAKNIAKHSSLDQEPDFWAKIDLVKTKKEQQIEPQTLVESSKAKTQCKVKTEQIQTLEWSNVEIFEAQHVQKTEVHTPIVLNGCPNYWPEISSTKREKPIPKNEQSHESNIRVESEPTDVEKVNTVASTGTNLNSIKTETSVESDPKPKRKSKKSITTTHTETETEGTKYTSKTKTSIPNENDEQNVESTKKLRKSQSETDPGSEAGALKLKVKKKIPLSKEESMEPVTNAELLKPKTKKKISTPVAESTQINIEAALKPKAKKKEVDNGEKRASIKTKSKKKHSLSSEEDTGFWDSSTKTSSKRTAKSCSLQVYSDYDIELIHIDPEPTFYPIHSEPETGLSFWATVSYAEEIPKVVEEKEIDFWASMNSGNEPDVNAEIDTGKIDFWVTQRKFEANTRLHEEPPPPNIGEATEEIDFWVTQRKFEANTKLHEEPPPPKIEEATEEVDFWAEIKGPNEEVCDEALPNDDCELRRNNYKKAMAFFTNTVSVEKKEEPKKFISVQEEAPSWAWRASAEPEWDNCEQREVDDVFIIVEDNETTEDEPDTLVENEPYAEKNRYNHKEQQNLQEEDEVSQSSESISDSTPNHFQIEHLYPKPEPEPIKLREASVEPISNLTPEESKISVKDRIFAFETGTVEPPAAKTKTSLIVDGTNPNSNLSRNSSQRSESEIEEDDSGVTDMNKPLSETDTESESFPELRKMSRYQRASTHSRLFKLLQDEGDVIEEEQPGDEEALEAEFNFRPRKKIVHNVSITRKQNPKALQEAETVSQRRQRLSLPLRKNQSIDADNPSSPNSPASPIQGQQAQPVSDQLVNELIQSLLLKKSSTSLKNLPMEKLQAAAKRVLEEELDSRENTSLDSTPALTPQEFKNESYADYYDTWSSKTESDNLTNGSFEILPSKAFKVLQETTGSANRKPWAVRCPRVLSSKTVNRDLARVTESPEIASRSSRSPEMFRSDRATSVGRWKKV